MSADFIAMRKDDRKTAWSHDNINDHQLLTKTQRFQTDMLLIQQALRINLENIDCLADALVLQLSSEQQLRLDVIRRELQRTAERVKTLIQNTAYVVDGVSRPPGLRVGNSRL